MEKNSFITFAPGEVGHRTIKIERFGIYIFVQLAFNLSNGVTDRLESSTILIYSDKHMSLYTQSVGRTPC